MTPEERIAELEEQRRRWRRIACRLYAELCAHDKTSADAVFDEAASDTSGTDRKVEP